MRAFSNYILTVFLVMSLASAADAASFDCAKAGTKVEKMICADPELSKLDEEMGINYSKALKLVRDPEEFKYNQKRWLRYRDGCSNVDCLKSRYSVKVASLKGAVSTKFSGNEKIFPPYPDVWLKTLPVRSDGSPTTSDLFKQKNGGVLVYYSYKPYGSDRKSDGFHFFETDRVESSTVGYAYLLLEEIKSSISIGLTGGSKVSFANLDPRQPQRCPEGLVYYYVLEYPDGRVLRKSVLLVRSEPKLVKVHDYCASTDEQSLKERVVALSGSIHPLEDGGFIFADGHEGLIIRFDADFNTKAEINGKRLFIVDTEKLEKLGVNNFEDMNYQHAQDNVLQYLKTL